MAELAVGLVGTAATIGAATLTTGSGFTARHESSLREEMTETRRSMGDFMENLQSGDVTRDEESEFLKTRDKAIRRQNEYHESVEAYKETSWFNLPRKLKKKKDVRRAKRLTRQSNHSLRSLNESMHSGSDTSSICASAGSPPGSNLAVDDIRDWIDDVDSGPDHHSVDLLASVSEGPALQLQPTSSLNIFRTPQRYKTHNASARQPQSIYTSRSRRSLDSQLESHMEQPSTRPNTLLRQLSLPAQLGRPTTSVFMQGVASFDDEPTSMLSPLIGMPAKTHEPSNRPLHRRSSAHLVRRYLSRHSRRNPSAVPLHALTPPRSNPLPDPPQEFGRHQSITLPVQRTPPPSYRIALRKGLWNRRGDHLTMDGFVVYAPSDCAYPNELRDYPAETVGYRDHVGTEIPYLASRPELPESLPRFGQPPRQPYEKFVVYEYMQ